MLSLCLIFQGTRIPVWEKFNSNVAAKCEYIFNDFYWLINLVKGRLVSLANAYNSNGFITFKEKNLVDDKIKAGCYALCMLKYFLQKSGLVCLYKIKIKKT